jgi:hypothetical protein
MTMIMSDVSNADLIRKDFIMDRKRIFAVLLLVSCVCLMIPADSFASSTCDRDCLKGYITQYLNAMIARKTDSLSLADNVRVTEDCKEIKVGEGYWKDFAGTVSYRLDIIDVRMGGAFAFVVIKNGSSSVLFGIRLKISNKKITQIETMVVKNSTEGMIFTPDGFKTPGDSAMTKMPKESELNTRDEMAAMAVKYPESFKLQNGTFAKGGVPFVKKAYRLENGQLMAGPGCTFFSGCDDIRTQGLPSLPKMLHQVALVDEQAGIVLLRMNFGAGSVMGDDKSTLDVFEAFKIYADSAYAVNAFMQKVPDATSRTPETMFNWNYANDVTSIDRNSFSTRSQHCQILITGKKLSIPLPGVFRQVTVNLYDISGHLVYSGRVSGNQATTSLNIPLNNIASGHYTGTVRYSYANGSTDVVQFSVPVVK